MQRDDVPRADLDVSGTSTDEVYAAMDWLAGRRRPSRRSWPPNTLPQR